MKELIESIGDLVTSILSVIFLGEEPDEPHQQSNEKASD